MTKKTNNTKCKFLRTVPEFLLLAQYCHRVLQQQIVQVNCRSASQGCDADDPMARSPDGPIWYAQVLAGHFFGLGDAEKAEERGRDVLERAPGAEGEIFITGGDSDQR